MIKDFSLNSLLLLYSIFGLFCYVSGYLTNSIKNTSGKTTWRALQWFILPFLWFYIYLDKLFHWNTIYLGFAVCLYWWVTSCDKEPKWPCVFWLNMQAGRDWSSGYCHWCSYLFFGKAAYLVDTTNQQGHFQKVRRNKWSLGNNFLGKYVILYMWV